MVYDIQWRIGCFTYGFDHQIPMRNNRRYLSKILSLLGESEYTIKSTKHFMEIIKQKKVPEGFQMVLFDV